MYRGIYTTIKITELFTSDSVNTIRIIYKKIITIIPNKNILILDV